MDPSIVSVITVTGAAGAFFLVLKWIVDGKLHTESEVSGLRQDKADLLKINTEQAEAMRHSNEVFEQMAKTYRETLEKPKE